MTVTWHVGYRPTFRDPLARRHMVTVVVVLDEETQIQDAVELVDVPEQADETHPAVGVAKRLIQQRLHDALGITI